MKDIIEYCNNHLGLNIDYPKDDNELFKLYNFLQGILDYNLRQMLKQIELPNESDLNELISNIKNKPKVFIYDDNTDPYELFYAEKRGDLLIFNNGEYLEIIYE